MCAAVTPTATSPDVFDPWLGSHQWDEAVLTYAFPTYSGYFGYGGTDVDNFVPMSTSGQDAVRDILDEIAGFTNLTFSELVADGTETEQATLVYAMAPTVGGAYAYLPWTDEFAGDSWYSTADVADPVIAGNEAYLYVLHEIGHTMGLEHGHEYPAFVASGFDSQEYTVVTYTDFVGDTDTFFFSGGPIDWAQSFQQLDIAAMQFMYGANYAATGEAWSGDTTYTFDPVTGEMSLNGAGIGAPAGNRIFRTIWDGHGTDTFDLSNYTTDQTINLAPGAWSTFDPAQLADLNGKVGATGGPQLAAGNVATARLVADDARGLIENATGGTGNDDISGNRADNHLRGGAGIDTLTGGAGADTLDGGTGADSMEGGEGDDVYVVDDAGDVVIELAGEGDDRVDSSVEFRLNLVSQHLETLNLTGSDDLIGFGNGQDNRIFGNSGNNTLIGGQGDDLLVGQQGNDIFRDQSGADTMRGGPGDDTYFLREVIDTVEEVHGEGDDMIFAWVDVLMFNVAPHVEDLRLRGSTDLDASGNGLDNRILGNPGANELNGARGNDTLRGFAGDDIFRDTAGDDVFDGGADYDRVIYTGAQADYSVVASGASTVVTHLGGGDDGRDVLRGIEEITFSDGVLLL